MMVLFHANMSGSPVALWRWSSCMTDIHFCSYLRLCLMCLAAVRAVWILSFHDQRSHEGKYLTCGKPQLSCCHSLCQCWQVEIIKMLSHLTFRFKTTCSLHCKKKERKKYLPMLIPRKIYIMVHIKCIEKPLRTLNVIIFLSNIRR